MTAAEGYVWFFPHWWTQDWYNNTGNTSCTPKQMKEVLAGCLVLQSAPLNPDPHAVVAGNLTVHNWTREYKKMLIGKSTVCI